MWGHISSIHPSVLSASTLYNLLQDVPILLAISPIEKRDAHAHKNPLALQQIFIYKGEERLFSFILYPHQQPELFEAAHLATIFLKQIRASGHNPLSYPPLVS